ncbi:MAG: universal stress protein [Acidobacteriota bacterium]|nr:universal stress protein [Acidobacteriota bacterium]
MFKHVVVGIDGDTHGRDAIALARVLGAADAELTFAHVHPAMTAAAMTAAAVTPGTASDARPSCPEEAHDLLVEAIKESGSDAWMRWIGSPNVGSGLHAIADQVGADLLVVGGSDRGRLTRTLLGNPTTETMAEADCPVAVAPLGYASASHTIRRVGVAYDESPASEGAMSLGKRLAEDLGAELSAFGVVSPPKGPLEPRRHQIERSVLALAHARERIAEHEGFDAQVACGRTVEELSGYSNTVDILVAGARGAGSLALLVHPSTTAALTRVVHCPLLVLTKGARVREAAVAG